MGRKEEAKVNWFRRLLADEIDRRATAGETFLPLHHNRKLVERKTFKLFKCNRKREFFVCFNSASIIFDREEFQFEETACGLDVL